MKARAVAGVLLGALTMVAMQLALAGLPKGQGVSAPAFSWQGLIVALAMAAILGWYTKRSDWPRARLWGGLVVATVGFQAVNLVESVLFRLASLAGNGSLLLEFGLQMMAMTTVIVWLVGTDQATAHAERAAPGATRSLRWWITRLSLAGVLYLILYFTAAIFAYRYVRHFYTPEATPSIELLIATQLLIRGPLLAVIVALVTRIVEGSRAVHGLAGALLLVGFGPLPLIAPNPILPASVRYIHLVEVGISNALFGFLVGRMLSAAEWASSDCKEEKCSP